jgi:polysaccharide transporter, PST family
MLSRFVKPWKEHAVSTVREVLDRRIVENALALYAAQFAHYLLPLVMVPYLARVLGPETWGLIVFIQAIAMYLQLVVDYAFDASATREVARSKDDPTRLSQLVSGVLGARVILSLGCIATVGIAQLMVPMLQTLEWLLWLGVFWFIATAHRPFWFFLGLERVRTILIIELAVRVVAVAAVIWLVNSPADAWKVLALQGGASAISTIAGIFLVYRLVPFRFPSITESVQLLREGLQLFVFRISISVYAMSNTIILGFVSSTASVGFYAGAERISRIVNSMIFPIAQATFPRATALVTDDSHAAARFARVSTISTFVLATIGAAILFAFAPLTIRILLGPGYEEAASVLRVLLLILPIVAINTPLATHWLIPLGLESILTKITISGGLLHIPLAAILGAQFAHVGIAWALVITEMFMLGTLITLLLVRRLGPFRLGIGDPILSAKTDALAHEDRS